MCELTKAVRQELESQIKRRTGALLESNVRFKAVIEERHKVEQSLRESERRFRMLFDNLFDAQLLMSADGQIRDVNRAACRLMSRSRDSLCTNTVTDLFPENEVGKIGRAFADEMK